MSKIRKPTLMIPTPAAFVKASLSKVGLAGGARFTGMWISRLTCVALSNALVGRPSGSTPYWSHSLLDYIVGCLGMKQLAVVYTHRLHQDIRRRVDRKLAKINKSQ